ncbi:MAG TPA: sugar ABC transporter permease [Candidatus Hydrogenedentes bacterium]|nr:sugar ABC transporter permease [Candidatus Hydrogenedentota bacterium]HQH67800.1 sugar ABC transporter permease [Candidatus Hydrogenedentota bacterium]HQM50494.1 sugar ABC transporter permease [Candidatus Hydrogenedentota bacterium]
MRSIRNGLLFISPWIAGFAAFTIYPLAASFYYSLCDYSVLKPPVFVGGANYHELLTDPVLWKSLYNTMYFAVFFLPLATLLAIVLALLLNTGVRGMTIYRTIFFLPSLTPLVALGILWMWMLNGEYGVVNYVLNMVLNPLGLQAPIWLQSTAWSKPAIILMSLWGVGHAVVIYLAGLQDIPKQLYEAADLDGARWFSKVRHITIPLLSPAIFFNVVMGLISALQVFALPYVLTDGTGGPARSTTFYTMYLYNSAFRYLRMGYACAMAWILFLIILALTLLVYRMSRKRVHYGG